MDKNINISCSGCSAFSLFLVFLVLKLVGVISWSWWWITAPLWGGFILYVIAFIILVLLHYIFG